MQLPINEDRGDLGETSGYLCPCARLDSRPKPGAAVLLQGLCRRAGKPKRQLPAAGPCGLSLDRHRERAVSIRWLPFLGIWAARRLARRFCTGPESGPGWTIMGGNARRAGL